MQPLFVHNRLLLSVLVANLIIFRIMESFVDIRSYRRLRAGARRQDKGSYLVLLILVVIGLLLGMLLAFKVPETSITIVPYILFWLGMLLMDTGIALRLYAIMVLGRFFTTAVSIAQEQTVIEVGPYRFMRHPAYSGFLLILLGFGFCLTNWLSLLVIMGCGLLGLGYRIHVEEQVLQANLGQRYRDYMQRTKRLIPFVL